jgi:hypothetical protein
LRKNERQLYENSLNEIYATHPGPRVLQGTIKEVHLTTVAPLLRKHSVPVLHYVVTRDSVLLFVVRDRGIRRTRSQSFTSKITSKELYRHAIGFQSALVNRKANFRYVASRSLRCSNQAGRKTNRGKSCIIPDGLFCKLSFAALQNDDDYLISNSQAFFMRLSRCAGCNGPGDRTTKRWLTAMLNPTLPYSKASRSPGFTTRSNDLLREEPGYLTTENGD